MSVVPSRPNPKGDLAQLFQTLFEQEVVYEVIEEHGPPHLKAYAFPGMITSSIAS